MAVEIIVNSQGNLHLHLLEVPEKPKYSLSEEELRLIRSSAPNWTRGVGKSSINDAEIEAQRQSFIRLNGNDGLNP